MSTIVLQIGPHRAPDFEEIEVKAEALYVHEFQFPLPWDELSEPQKAVYRRRVRAGEVVP